MEAKLIKENDGYTLYVDGKIIGSTEGHPLKSITNKLSIKNCQAIELGYDLDELADKYEAINYQKGKSKSYNIGFKHGFQKALELMGDKKFSEEDMEKSFEAGRGYQDHLNMQKAKYFEPEEMHKIDYVKYSFSSWKESLQQTEWDVEVEMEFVGRGKHGIGSEVNHYMPKRDADGCLILKRK